jgi:hypothetical protein
MERQASNRCIDAGVPVGTGALALAALAAIVAKAAEIRRELRISKGPRQCWASLSRRRRRAQGGAVAKLIQSMDNSRLTER